MEISKEELANAKDQQKEGGKWHKKPRRLIKGGPGADKLPEIVLDECIWNPGLQKSLAKLGYNVMFLGSGKPDRMIGSYCRTNNHNSIEKVLITADQEFWSTMKKENECMLIETELSNQASAKIIDGFMWQFKELGKEGRTVKKDQSLCDKDQKQ